jgi:GrpB-like predicted nucleotidyltransferase (UPF0157 family)
MNNTTEQTAIKQYTREAVDLPGVLCDIVATYYDDTHERRARRRLRRCLRRVKKYQREMRRHIRHPGMLLPPRYIKLREWVNQYPEERTEYLSYN